MPIYVKGAGENIFLVVRNVQEQLSEERRLVRWNFDLSYVLQVMG